MTLETVTVIVRCFARPQLIAPNGRWFPELHGRGFEIHSTAKVCHSSKGAESAGRRLAKRLRLKVSDVLVEKAHD